jgi:predicted phage terminase large subunit-like protein
MVARAILETRQWQRAATARRVLARRHLIDFARCIDPAYLPARHLSHIAGWLERVASGEVKRLMLFAPPRHGKSKLATELFPAWVLGRDPSQQFMIASHSAELAYTFSRNVRNTIGLETFAELFPATRLSDDNATVQRWTLEGFTRPAMLAVGVGGSPTGQGARIAIIDDPIGSASDADSALSRENTYRWYTDTIRPRLEPGGAVVLMMQRWHEDDLAGRLLRDAERDGEPWQVVNLPALAEAGDALDREAGAALWPERWPVHELEAIRSVSARSFEAKYQQRPRPSEGALFKRAWLRIADAAPQGLRWVRYWDLAYSLKASADNSATISAAMDGAGVIYLRRGWAGREETPDLRRRIKSVMLSERQSRHGIEKAMHGGGVVQDLRREPDLVSIALEAVDVDKDKMSRATPVADRAEAGKLVFVRESISDDRWIQDWIDELCAFPFAAHDDRVDAVSGVFAMLATQSRGVYL